jgi:hypothetical protein
MGSPLLSLPNLAQGLPNQACRLWHEDMPNSKHVSAKRADATNYKLSNAQTAHKFPPVTGQRIILNHRHSFVAFATDVDGPAMIFPANARLRSLFPCRSPRIIFEGHERR